MVSESLSRAQAYEADTALQVRPWRHQKNTSYVGKASWTTIDGFNALPTRMFDKAEVAELCYSKSPSHFRT